MTERIQRVMVITAHPDDVDFGAAGSVEQTAAGGEALSYERAVVPVVTWFTSLGRRFTPVGYIDGIRRKLTAWEQLKRAVKGTKYARIRGWHLFRHSLASILAAAGTDQRTIDATLGHQTEDMRKRYRHLFPSKQRTALASIFG